MPALAALLGTIAVLHTSTQTLAFHPTFTAS
jgi:hypothetical protein